MGEEVPGNAKKIIRVFLTSNLHYYFETKEELRKIDIGMFPLYLQHASIIEIEKYLEKQRKLIKVYETMLIIDKMIQVKDEYQYKRRSIQ